MLHTAKRGLFNKPNLVDSNTARAGFSFAGYRRSTFTKQLLLLLLCCFLLSVLFCIWFWQIYHKYYFWIFQSFCIVCVVVVCFLSLAERAHFLHYSVFQPLLSRIACYELRRDPFCNSCVFEYVSFHLF